MAKEISNSAYQWGHFGVIVFEVIIFSIIAYLAFRIKNAPEVLKDVNTFWVSIFMIVLSLLGLIPVFKNYEGGIVINQ